jgi:hypothetical protein
MSISRMAFEQVQVLVNFLYQGQPVGQHMNGAQASTADGPPSLGNFIMNIAALKRWLQLIGGVLFAQGRLAIRCLCLRSVWAQDFFTRNVLSQYWVE